MDQRPPSSEQESNNEGCDSREQRERDEARGRRTLRLLFFGRCIAATAYTSLTLIALETQFIDPTFLDTVIEFSHAFSDKPDYLIETLRERGWSDQMILHWMYALAIGSAVLMEDIGRRMRKIERNQSPD